MADIYDVAIIGAGPAGMTAALYCGRANLSTVMFGNIFESQLAKAGAVENYPGFDSIQGIELVEKFNSQLGRYNIVTIPAHIGKVVPGETFTLISEGAEVQGRCIIIATGSKHKELKINGEKEFANRGVSYCAVCDGSFYKGKPVALIGEGDHAAKSALYLAGLCKEVYVFAPGQDIETTAYASQIEEFGNIHVIGNSKITAIEGAEEVERIRYIANKQPESLLEVKGVFIEGGAPNSRIARDLGLEIDTKGNVVVKRPDHTTNVEGVFAAGDVTGGIHQISKAVGEGASAAVSAAIYLKKKIKGRSR